MSKYITNFETTVEFNAAKASFVTPHVSYVKEENNVYYFPKKDN